MFAIKFLRETKRYSLLALIVNMKHSIKVTGLEDKGHDNQKITKDILMLKEILPTDILQKRGEHSEECAC